MRRLKRAREAAAENSRGRVDESHWDGFPGPAWPPAEDEPIRVAAHTFASWGEGHETYWVELARAMPREAIRWYFLIDPPLGRPAVQDSEVGGALREFGEVRILPAVRELRPAAVRQAICDWRPHVGHAVGSEGARMLMTCGLPTVMARDGISGLSAPEWVPGLAARVAHSPVASDREGRAEVIVNGIGEVSWPARRRRGTVALVGRLDRDRNPEIILQAIAEVPAVRLEIAGVARRRSFDPIEMGRQLGCADRIIWHGQVDRETAREIAGAADIIIDAAAEGFGYGLLEGILGGAIPVVVGGRGYQTELAREAGGFIADPDPHALADAIRQALAQVRGEEERRQVARRMAAKYRAEAMAQGYLEVYRRVLPPVVDIILLASGEAAITRACLMHVLANTWWPYRLIMVDNGSPGDDITWLMREVALLSGTRCVLLRTDENRGCAGGRRLGLEHSEADYIVTLDNDMLVPAGWLGPLIQTMLSHPDAGAVGAWWSAYGPPPAGGPIRRNFGCAAALLRRAALPADAYATPLAAGQVGNDTDLLWGMLEAGWKLYLEPRSYWLHVGGPPGLLGMTRRKVLGPGDEREARLAFDAKWAAPGVRR